MSISPVCNKCGKRLKEFGGLVFSPPNKKDIVKKYHLCVRCFVDVEKKFLQGLKI